MEKITNIHTDLPWPLNEDHKYLTEIYIENEKKSHGPTAIPQEILFYRMPTKDELSKLSDEEIKKSFSLYADWIKYVINGEEYNKYRVENENIIMIYKLDKLKRMMMAKERE